MSQQISQAPADELVEMLARAAYERMVRCVNPAPDWSICGWLRQHENLREDWRAAIIAVREAIQAAGYRLHRDHDMEYVAAHSFYPARFRCKRCGHYNTDLGMPTMSCEPR
jgi:hypothetical protein